MDSAIFTVDVEDWFHAVFPESQWWSKQRRIEEPMNYLLDILDKYDVQALFFMLGAVAADHKGLVDTVKSRGHLIGSHGYFHGRNEQEGDRSDRLAREILGPVKYYRSPYWDSTPLPGYCGGFFFRVLPFWFVKSEVSRTGMFYIHPHDLMTKEIHYKDPVMNIKRNIGLKSSRLKLEKLLTEVKFENVSDYEPSAA